MDRIELGKKYRYRNGNDAKVLCVDRPAHGTYCVISMDEESGVVTDHDIYGCSKYSKQFNLVEVSPWDHIHRGDVVEVRSTNSSKWTLRRFSHVGPPNGKPHAYLNTTNSSFPWDECRLVCKKEDEEWRQ